MFRIITATITILLLFGCGTKKPEAVKETRDSLITAIPGLVTDTLFANNLPEKLFINIYVKGFGKIKVEMFTKDAPLNVTNVANLAIKGFYNGLTFHRIEPGFVVQGGDPKGDGTGGPGYTVPAEIKRKHEKGAMAMARLGDEVNPNRESSGSQFYFCLQPLPMLDGKYTVIGQIVEGMEVLEKLGQAKPPVEMERVFVTTE
ncbi:MAG: peptidylprolyl isomerase [candidate division WOR-3 bacterium]